MDLPAEFEQKLSELDPASWDALVARVREPVVQPGAGGIAEAERRFKGGAR